MGRYGANREESNTMESVKEIVIGTYVSRNYARYIPTATPWLDISLFGDRAGLIDARSPSLT